MALFTFLILTVVTIANSLKCGLNGTTFYMDGRATDALTFGAVSKAQMDELGVRNKGFNNGCLVCALRDGSDWFPMVEENVFIWSGAAGLAGYSSVSGENGAEPYMEQFFDGGLSLYKSEYVPEFINAQWTNDSNGCRSRNPVTNTPTVIPANTYAMLCKDNDGHVILNGQRTILANKKCMLLKPGATLALVPGGSFTFCPAVRRETRTTRRNILLLLTPQTFGGNALTIFNGLYGKFCKEEQGCTSFGYQQPQTPFGTDQVTQQIFLSAIGSMKMQCDGSEYFYGKTEAEATIELIGRRTAMMPTTATAATTQTTTTGTTTTTREGNQTPTMGPVCGDEPCNETLLEELFVQGAESAEYIKERSDSFYGGIKGMDIFTVLGLVGFVASMLYVVLKVAQLVIFGCLHKKGRDDKIDNFVHLGLS